MSINVFKPLGISFRIRTTMSPAAARNAARGCMDKSPGSWDEVWGFTVGPLIFMQEGLYGSPPALFGRITTRHGPTEIAGYAGVNLGGLALFSAALLGMLIFGALELFVSGSWQLLAIAAGLLGFLYVIAWSNYPFRKDAQSLVHLLQKAVSPHKIAQVGKSYDRTPVNGTSLIVDGRAPLSPVSAHQVQQAVLSLKRDEFVLVSFAEENYMQALKRNEDFQLEVRKGSADQHLRADDHLDAEAVCSALADYLEGETLPSAVKWNSLSL